MATKEKSRKDDTAIYKKKTDREGMLEMPSVFIGSAVPEKQVTWTVGSGSHCFVRENVRIAPGLCTVIKEIINNAADQSTLSEDVTAISVDIDSNGVITVINSGTGLPAAKHHKYTDTWTVQMCFTDFRTSSHYDRIGKTSKTFSTTDITGGAHGYGAKTTVCFSKWFEIVTIDKKRGKKYSQRYENNMLVVNPPKITDYDCSKHSVFTRVTFLPDYQRFEYDYPLTKAQYDAVFKITEKIAYDTAGTTSPHCMVVFNNDTSLPQTFEDYASCYLTNCDESSIITSSLNDYWRICVAPQNQKASQTIVSLVNHIPIPRGGTHVNFVIRKLLQCFKEDKKFSTLTEAQLKRALIVIIDCMIACPEYESQAKVSLKTNCHRFRTIEYKYEFPDTFKEAVLKNREIRATLDAVIKSDRGGILTNVTKSASKMQGGLASYEPASLCDNVNRKKRTILFITEGISAKDSAMVARQVLGVDVVGIFPIRGKILNIKNASQRSVENSIIVTNLLRVVGIGTNRARLKYDDIVFFTDQDDDGFHIRALLLLFFHELYPTIAESNSERLCYFSTPLVTYAKGKNQREFYSMKQLEEWCKECNVSDKARKSDNFRYCKGLGTIKRSVMKEYLTDYDTHTTYITFDEYAPASLNLAFNSMTQFRKLRKEWIGGYDEASTSRSIVSTVGKKVSVTKMINKQLIQFSMADNIRSLPDVMSGLKESQRKVLYSCFYKKPIQTRKPMIQVFGTVFKKALYHHGDSSLHGVICGMTQDFVGSNNIPYFDPDEGSYGTRVNCEPAAARYLNVRRNPIMDKMFVHTDYEILPKHVEQGIQIEPKMFLPIIPMLLVNGSTGIGTGFRTEVLAYNPLDIVPNIIRALNKKPIETIVPYYEGFKGETIVLENEKYMFVGTYEIIGDKTVRITELPVGIWTDSYKRWLEALCIGAQQKTVTKGTAKKSRTTKKGKAPKAFKTIKRKVTQFQKRAHEILLQDQSDVLVGKVIYRNTAVSVCIDCVLKCSAESLRNIKFSEDTTKRDSTQLDGIINYFKLFRIVKQALTVFNTDGVIYEFKDVPSLLEYWVAERKKWYSVRKKYILEALARDVLEISSRARFIKLILEDELVLKHKPRNKIISELEQLEFDKINDTFNYLLSMHIDSVSKEKWEKLQKELELKRQKFESISRTKPTNMWLDDLQSFVKSFVPVPKVI
jgi:DNA topoisomerase-2